jgi:hypothetical protein
MTPLSSARPISTAPILIAGRRHAAGIRRGFSRYRPRAGADTVGAMSSARLSILLGAVALAVSATPAAAVDVSASSVTGLRLEPSSFGGGASLVGLATVNAGRGGSASSWALSCLTVDTLRLTSKCLENDPDVVASRVACDRSDLTFRDFALFRTDLVRMTCPRLAPGIQVDLTRGPAMIADRDALTQGGEVDQDGVVDIESFLVTPFISDDPVTITAPTQITGSYRIEFSDLSRPTGFWRIVLARGDDTFRMPLAATGGSDVRTGPGDDIVRPGGGNDFVDLGSGSDRLEAGAAPDGQPDSYVGGPGIDTLDYGLRSAPVTVAGFTSGVGSAGEGGDQAVEFERVIGGSGDDFLLGMPSALGGPGDDLLTARQAGSVLVGGPGIDTMRGGPGDDRINARDGERDVRVECGAGEDLLLLDLVDPLPLVPRACETLSRLAIDEGEPTGVGRVVMRADGRLAVAVTCPSGARRACAGRLTASLARGGARNPAPVRYRVASGRRALVSPPLTAREGARLRRSAAVVVVTSREVGRSGPKTVIARRLVAAGGSASG